VAIVIVQHLDPRHRSVMADILSRRTPLKVKQAEAGESLFPATVYIAPPDRHLLVNSDGTLSLTQSELVHFVRPSADLLFESVAASYRDRAIAVILSGSGSDGAMGAQAIKKMGGTVIAQDEATAEFPGMPSAVIKTRSVDFILPLAEIAPALASLVLRVER
jgi:two-component system chemotaxis response regulator CheB